jgi:hypothetical protein
MIADRFINYGIQNEKSDIRAHVSVVNRGVFVFQTSAGVEAIEKHKPRAVWAGQPGVVG